MKTIGTILTCTIHGDRCPFNWEMIVEGAEYVTYVRNNCPQVCYEQRERSAVCKWAREVRQ